MTSRYEQDMQRQEMQRQVEKLLDDQEREFPDLVKYHIGVFMYKYYNQLLPFVFNTFLLK